MTKKRGGGNDKVFCHIERNKEYNKSLLCHSECSEESLRDFSVVSLPQNDKKKTCHSELTSCHSERSEESKENHSLFGIDSNLKGRFIKKMIFSLKFH